MCVIYTIRIKYSHYEMSLNKFECSTWRFTYLIIMENDDGTTFGTSAVQGNILQTLFKFKKTICNHEQDDSIDHISPNSRVVMVS